MVVEWMDSVYRISTKSAKLTIKLCRHYSHQNIDKVESLTSETMYVNKILTFRQQRRTLH